MKTTTTLSFFFLSLLSTPAIAKRKGKETDEKVWQFTGVVPYTLKHRHPDGEPKHCDGTLYHLCCHRYEGELYTDQIKGVNCLPYKEIAVTEERNKAGLVGGKCNHEHLCCTHIRERKKYDMDGDRLKGVEHGTGCRIVWSYDDKVREALGFDGQAKMMKDALDSTRPGYNYVKPSKPKPKPHRNSTATTDEKGGSR